MKQDPFLRQIADTLRRHDLIPPDARVLASVSGGADSTALLLALAALAPGLKATLVAAHLHHGIRGRAADDDARQVRRLCRALGVRLIVGRARVPDLARRKGLSLEMAARDARRAFLVKTSRRVGCTHLATGHTADDQAETVLMRILQGTGPRGLGGMAYRAARPDCVIVRPLLDVSHEEAEAYCRRRRVLWCEDASNRDARILRNRLRHELLPLLERRFNPGVRQALRRLADVAREEEAWLDVWTADRLRECKRSGSHDLDVNSLRPWPLAVRRRILLQWLTQAGAPADGLDFDAIARIDGLVSTVGGSRTVPLAGSWRVVREYDRLRLDQRGARAARRLAVAVRLGTSGTGCWRAVVEKSRGYRALRSEVVGRLPSECWVDARKARRAKLVLRPWQPGDRIRPWGLTGSVKIQDVFVNAKVPRENRDAIPVLACGREVIWVPGYRVARDWAVPGPQAPSWHVRLVAAG